MEKRNKKIVIFSRLLRYGCYIGMLSVPALPILNWIIDGIWFCCARNPKFFLDFSNLPLDYIDHIPLKIKILGFMLDLLQNFFFFIVYYSLTKLMKLYEQLHFFKKKSVYYIRLIGHCLVLSQIVRPFYKILRIYMWALPGEKITIPFYNLIGFKTLFLAFITYLIAYIIEAGHHFEEEYNGTV